MEEEGGRKGRLTKKKHTEKQHLRPQAMQSLHRPHLTCFPIVQMDSLSLFFSFNNGEGMKRKEKTKLNATAAIGRFA